MEEYNPMVDPDSELWKMLDEDERITLVMAYHEAAGIDMPDDYAHAVLHVVVESQIAMGATTPAEAVLRRLIKEKLDRHDAIHAIASVFVNHMHELLHVDDSTVSNDDYYAALANLTAEKWLRGDYADG